MNSELRISIRPGRRFFASTFKMPGVVKVWAMSDRLMSDLRYPSRFIASTALGPTVTVPSIIRVRCTPRNGMDGSGIG
ncbi:hypothetical protein D3C71_1667620 [compost metagenome]